MRCTLNNVVKHVSGGSDLLHQFPYDDKPGLFDLTRQFGIPTSLSRDMIQWHTDPIDDRIGVPISVPKGS